MLEVMSHIFVLSGVDATKNGVVEDWMTAKYTGEGVQQSVGTYTYTQDAPERIAFKRNCQTVANIDLRFKDESGTAFTPTRGFLKMKFNVPKS